MGFFLPDENHRAEYLPVINELYCEISTIVIVSAGDNSRLSLRQNYPFM